MSVMCLRGWMHVALTLSLTSLAACESSVPVPKTSVAKTRFGVACPPGTRWIETHDSDGTGLESYETCILPNNEAHGPVAGLMTSGTRVEGRYDRAQMTGVWRAFNPKTGALLGSFTMANGNGIESQWYPAGQLLSRGEMRASKPHGAWTYYLRDGKLALTEIYDNGTLVSHVGKHPLGEMLDPADRCPAKPSEADCKKEGCCGE